MNDSSAIVGTATYTGTNYPTGSHGVLLLPVDISSVSFAGDPSTTNYWPLESDDGTKQYSAPQWTDTNGSTNTTDPGVHNYAVAYTQNTHPWIGATFKIPEASNWS
ncbi:MAG: hypothetical protein LV479_03515, partial [Methylacidiphilales bacterium]|nr:hypothetical protein [Candidatus Methylacidiphilales bacterium]